MKWEEVRTLEEELAALRHAGVKRWYGWMEHEPGAADAVEAWRVQVCGLLRARIGPAVESEFNEPRSTDQPAGTPLSLLNQHGHRLDRLGDILTRLFGRGLGHG